MAVGLRAAVVLTIGAAICDKAGGRGGSRSDFPWLSPAGAGENGALGKGGNGGEGFAVAFPFWGSGGGGGYFGGGVGVVPCSFKLQNEILEHS